MGWRKALALSTSTATYFLPVVLGVLQGGLVRTYLDIQPSVLVFLNATCLLACESALYNSYLCRYLKHKLEV